MLSRRMKRPVPSLSTPPGTPFQKSLFTLTCHLRAGATRGARAVGGLARSLDRARAGLPAAARAGGYIARGDGAGRRHADVLGVRAEGADLVPRARGRQQPRVLR